MKEIRLRFNTLNVSEFPVIVGSIECSEDGSDWLRAGFVELLTKNERHLVEQLLSTIERRIENSVQMGSEYQPKRVSAVGD